MAPHAKKARELSAVSLLSFCRERRSTAAGDLETRNPPPTHTSKRDRVFFGFFDEALEELEIRS
jgi:hypothetical protein